MMDKDWNPIPLQGRLRKYNHGGYENLNKANFSGVGMYDLPAIRRVNIHRNDIPEMISFNYAKGCDEPELHGVHFFIDDYQFNRVWQDPDRYTKMLSKFSLVTEPDFSAYGDFPKAMQIYNIYRKRWCAAYWQAHGIRVIPSFDVAAPECREWFYDGLPKGGALAINPMGIEAGDDGYCEGLREAFKYLEPELVMSFGELPCDVSDLTEVVRIATFTDKLHAMNKITRLSIDTDNTGGL